MAASRECRLDQTEISGAEKLPKQVDDRAESPIGDIAELDTRAAHRWIRHMLKGDFESAWIESDAIRIRGAYDPHRFWDGESLEGKRVIVRCLHGLGDAVQFLRYSKRLRDLASELVIEVPPALMELAWHIEGVDRVITWGQCSPGGYLHWDKQIEVMELPYYFRTQLKELPIAQNYVHLPEELCDRVARAMGTPAVPRVGLVWAAGDWNQARSIPFVEMMRLLAVPGCEFWNLQGGSAHAEWLMIAPDRCARDGGECGDGLMTLAGVINQLDLVITVDTLAAHLAGALEKPAWVLLERDADWRWMTDRCDTPWYPSLRLFRQARKNDWNGLISLVKEQLQFFVHCIQAGR